MPLAEPFDFVIVGAGQCALPLSRALGDSGHKTALIERAYVGGTCINVGCTPTKTMVASAKVAYLARRAADYGVDAGSISVDMRRVRDRKRGIVESFRGGDEHRIQQTQNLTFIRGDAHFSGSKTLAVQTQDGVRTLTADTIVLDTGGRPAVPSIPGLSGVPHLDSTSVMELDQVPNHLVVLGGGYIALEFAQMFRRFGSRVTVVEKAGQLMAREDDDIAGEVRKILEQDGIEILLNASADGVEGGPGVVRLAVTTKDGSRTVEGSHLLVAVGRTPNTDSLNLGAAGITVNDRGYIPVNEYLETTVAGIYAVGDVNGEPAFTHISYDDYRVLKASLIDGKPSATTGRPVPYVLYIDPQLGRVGLSENEARHKGLDIAVAKMPMSHVARALETDESRGLMKVVVEKATGKILGAAILGLEGGEIMSALQIAMMGGVTVDRLRDGIFAHPTLMESLNNLFAKMD